MVVFTRETPSRLDSYFNNHIVNAAAWIKKVGGKIGLGLRDRPEYKYGTVNAVDE
jgi:hypothetical protein